MQQVDVIVQENSLSYFLNQPEGIFRTYSFRLHETNTWDFGGAFHAANITLNGEFHFLNLWAVEVAGGFTSAGLDTRLLRGGPAMRVPAVVVRQRVCAHRWISDGVRSQCMPRRRGRGRTAADAWSLEPALTMTPTRLSGSPSGLSLPGRGTTCSMSDVQNAMTEDPLTSLDGWTSTPWSARYARTTASRPELTIQYYGSPFSSVGRFSDFKTVTSPRADRYGDRFVRVQDPATIGNPDFAFSQFRSNLVARWEFRPGSNVYLVWSQDRTAFEMPGDPSAGATLWQLRQVAPENVLMLKISYWFTV